MKRKTTTTTMWDERVKGIGIKIIVTTPHYFVNKIYNLSEYRSGFVVDISVFFGLLAWSVVWLPQTIQCLRESKKKKEKQCSNQIDYAHPYIWLKICLMLLSTFRSNAFILIEYWLRKDRKIKCEKKTKTIKIMFRFSVTYLSM